MTISPADQLAEIARTGNFAGWDIGETDAVANLLREAGAVSHAERVDEVELDITNCVECEGTGEDADEDMGTCAECAGAGDVDDYEGLRMEVVEIVREAVKNLEGQQ
jgi:hypothetical protein